jgi:hypothetical protein
MLGGLEFGGVWRQQEQVDMLRHPHAWTQVLPNVKTKIYRNRSGPSDYDFDDVALWLFNEQRKCWRACLLSCYPLVQFTTA